VKTTSRARWPRPTPTTGVINPSDLTAWRHVGTDTKQTAFFGEVTYKPIDKLSLTGGLRRFNYDKTVSGQVLISNFITQSYVGPAAQVDASADGWVSKFNVSYQVTSDVMVYGWRPRASVRAAPTTCRAWPARCWPTRPTACGTTKAA
jgi:outer membrane receptor protein involved in Fe transport